jgi:hypothetical protein
VNTLPVGSTIRAAYAFAFGQLGTIIGLIWAPMVAIAVLRFLPYGIGDMSHAPDQNATQAGAAMLRSIVFTLVSLLLYAVINVALIRQALGLRKGGAVFHFALGTAEFRVWGATLLLMAILGTLALGCLLAMMTVTGAVAAAAGQAAGTAAGALALLGGSILLLVAIVRLSFLYVPIAVVENKISFERGWLLTQGNFWRIAGVLFVVTLPVFVVVFGAFLILMGPDFAALVPIADKLSPEVLSDRIEAIVDKNIATIIGVNLIVAPFSLGLALGAAAEGYKALAGTSGAAASE